MSNIASLAILTAAGCSKLKDQANGQQDQCSYHKSHSQAEEVAEAPD